MSDLQRYNPSARKAGKPNGDATYKCIHPMLLLHAHPRLGLQAYRPRDELQAKTSDGSDTESTAQQRMARNTYVPAKTDEATRSLSRVGQTQPAEVYRVDMHHPTLNLSTASAHPKTLPKTLSIPFFSNPFAEAATSLCLYLAGALSFFSPSSFLEPLV